ncbi:beta-cyclopiazonate dehydrogenase [Penicillium argentinense]|uniref:Beta-cyclopiazonate dehydrogenase n=1 Tax=Penicillium argentinense TaxID=1131581 RepID=A0A9W9EHU5_9EURO|nr:beta-cyclopiazonate dehydrogenase [Penicillium argentinense]KAJ5082084.1 beta-cyclopiazonate dehydrogenase [Penicillium argentinense]
MLLGFALFTSLGHSQVKKPIIKDVAIIGGGSSGTYAAIRLHDEGKSVILVEKEIALGGHNNIYIDSATKQAVNYVEKLSGLYPPNVTFVDIDTAQATNYTPPDITAALRAYIQQLSQYPSLDEGYFLPDPVPEDLLLPFQKFVAKYPDIGNLTYTISQFGQGLGDILNQPTLYIFKIFGFNVINAFTSGVILPTSRNNHEIYDRASKILGQDVLYRSTVISTRQRDSKGIELKVNTLDGTRIIKAKKLLITIPPKLTTLIPFTPDHRESTLFNEFTSAGYYTSLVRKTSLPANLSTSSVGPDAPFSVAQLPGPYSVSPTSVDGVFTVKYGAQHPLPEEYVQGDILDFISKLQNNGFSGNYSGRANLLRFNSHVPFELTISPGRIAAGFYRDLYALQGYRNTWYTGAAFHVHDSTRVWNFTEAFVLPGLLQGL